MNEAELSGSQQIGAAFKARRKALKVSPTRAAQAAAISRVTLHRVERGDTSVNVGAYLRVADALGLALNSTLAGGDQSNGSPTDREAALPWLIPIDQYPQLKLIAWSLPDLQEIDPPLALGLYERNWRYVDQAAMTPQEQDLVNRLVKEHGNGCVFV
ncbi:helix-turn-helix domain-containing protein [Aquabacterium sp.]|uniref:helix-turn-helix domain-containing protein n=1 Tax=Aquabacterium sp. TaxID=1872578 RepID=UPI0019B4940E|nr:helix-turn-helix domain-containing protein [Aquabacterium sp.]MBC7700230.1 helix-turn-helix domain-containing protein [Aquabacterium sp.]